MNIAPGQPGAHTRTIQAMKTYTEEELLSDIDADTAANAYNGTSFDPEKRGESIRKEYAGRILDFAQYIEETAVQASDEQKDAELDRYHSNMRDAYLRYIGAHSRCISVMIIGGSKFPVRRAEKANASEQNAYRAIRELEEKARASIRKRFGAPNPNAPILSDDPDAIDKLRAKLEANIRMHDRMKAANKAIRAAKGDNEKARSSLAELGFTPSTIRNLLAVNYMNKRGFEGWELSNILTEIKRLKARIADIEARRARPDESGENEDGVSYEVDNADARVKIYFPSKPDDDIRADLKRHGYRWAPSNGAWQAHINARSVDFAKKLIGANQQ